MFKNLISIPLVTIGYIYFILTKKTPNFIYQSLVRSYCFTNGKIIIFLNFFIHILDFFLYSNKKKNIKIKSIFSNINYQEIDKTLKKDSYYIFSEKLPDEIINKLLNFSKKNKTFYFDDSGVKKEDFFKNESDKYDSSKYSYEISSIYNAISEELIFEPTFINIAKNYFGSTPHFSNLDMWWSPAKRQKLNFDTEAANKSAQMFHFDLDKIQFLKVFIYLNDISVHNGPHEYVEGSHKINSKPKELRDLGYKRLPDNLVRKYYPQDKIKKILGSKGTIFVGDTSCYHRGVPPSADHRLLLVIEYSNSLFGGNNTNIFSNFPVKSIESGLIIKDKITFKSN
jgi:hypothetical protein